MTNQTLIPDYWKSSLKHIDDVLSAASRGQVTRLGMSAGNRPIHSIGYGEKEDFRRRANYNSACGAKDLSAYAQKDRHSRPVLLIVGGIHGGELEGIAAMLNLIHLLETGEDLRGERHDGITRLFGQFRLVVVPCMNPDGRARIPADTFVGMPLEQMRYHIQGTWKDGTLCGWPQCKAVHPIAPQVSHLGGYFNDDGINLMHDNFFAPMAAETKLLMELADSEAADATVLLHGGANTVNHILPLHYAPAYILELQNKFLDQLYDACLAKELKFWRLYSELAASPGYPPPSFNLTSALHHLTGGLSMTYECNMSLDAPGERFSYAEMLDSHLVLFEQLMRFMQENSPLGAH
ncbi:MAG: hypothetical protein J7639_28100 [Paenibacillaceae bacterium]|nr:hypothetical protein [Paenibacillaceae bacterium]